MFKIVKFILVFLFALALISAFSYWRGINQPVSKDGEQMEFEIAKGEGAKMIAANLEKAGLISSGSFFEIFIWRTDRQKELKAGIYELSPSMNIKEIADIISAGKIVDRELDLVIIEGWRTDHIDDYLFKKGFSEQGEFAESALRPIGEWAFGFEKPEFLKTAPVSASLEGYLFPDTYRVYSDAGIEDIIKKMLDNFGKKISGDLAKEIEDKNKNLHDVVIMASIVEKEVFGEDSPIVAGILYKRLEIGMRLEVDATINYITKKNNPSSDSADLAIESPYNTYRNYGLPPGPISNPGLLAITASVFPKKSPYLFYLNRQDTRETIFSKNFEEHVSNKHKYLK